MRDNSLTLAMDIGGTKISAATIFVPADRKQRPVILHKEILPTGANHGGTAVEHRVIRLITKMLDDLSLTDGISTENNIDEVKSNLNAHRGKEVIRGIGIGAAGVVDSNGTISSATDIIPDWTGISLGRDVTVETGLPCRVLGDVQAHALGEADWGAGRGAASMMMVSVGTGIGGALVIKGEVISGYHNAAGHIGHVLHPAGGNLICSCGCKGHLEPVSSGRGIETAYEKAVGRTLSGSQIAELADEGDIVARRVVGRAGVCLGNVIGAQANFFDPEIVVLSGSVSNAGKIWLDAVRAGYKQESLGYLRGTSIVLGELGNDAPLMGAAAYLLGCLTR